MDHREFRMDSASEGVQLRCVRWIPDGEPLCAVLIVHGMMEHIMRHSVMAEMLCRSGAVVYGYDQLGHGLTADGDLGHIADRDGDSLLVSDCESVFSRMASEFPGIPHMVVGHSMGSFVARRLLASGVPADAAVLTATGEIPVLKLLLGRMYVGLRCRLNGGRTRSDKLNRAVVGGYSIRFRTSEGHGDPMCGFLFSNRALYDLMSLIRGAMADGTGRMTHGTPVLLASGKRDPVGGYGKGVIRTSSVMADGGMRPEVYLYTGAGHSLFGRATHGRAESDIVRWVLRTADSAIGQQAVNTGEQLSNHSTNGG